MKIARADPDQAGVLTQIAFAAKRHWGYPEHWMLQWCDALTVSGDYIGRHPTYVAVADGKPVGFCALQFAAQDAALDHLWVLPPAMGRGIGRALFDQAETVARKAGARRLTIVGDPHAVGFYLRLGATIYGQNPASMDDGPRFLPLLEKQL